jgi:hypothetical protein
VPALDAIGRLLGERPALKPHETLYQRLLARDVDEADGIVRRQQKERSVDDACQLVLDTLLTLKRDLQAGRVSADDGVFVLGALHESVEDLRTVGAEPAYDPETEPPVLLIGAPGRDPLDALVLELVRVLLRGEPATLEVLSTDLMVGEAMAAIEAKAPAAVVVPSLPPAGLTSARHLCLRLHARLPRVVLLAARLGDPEDEASDRAALLEAAGCTDTSASLPELKSALQRIVRAARSGAPPTPETLSTAISA